MLDLLERDQEANGHKIGLLKRWVEKTDREINERVYELYGVTTNEKRLIEL